jgi:hypothetical protein
LIHEFYLLTLTYVDGSIVCGWFTSGWLRITIQIESCDSSVFSSRFLRWRRSITNRCWLIVRTSTRRDTVNWAQYYWWAQDEPSCLLRSRDHTIMPSTTRTWGGTTRKRWLQYGTAWTLMSTWTSRYCTLRSLWMSCPTYHIHTRLSEQLAFNQSIFS